MTLRHQGISNAGAQHAAPLHYPDSRKRMACAFALVLFGAAFVTPSLLGKCKCHRPEKGETTRYGGNIFVIQDEEKPYRELRGQVELKSQGPLEDALVEIFDQPEYLLKHTGKAPSGQKRLAACVTSDDGKFCFRNLRPGKYELRASWKTGVNVTHVYVVVDKKAGQAKDLVVGLTVGV